jgi:hypothetical protein
MGVVRVELYKRTNSAVGNTPEETAEDPAALVASAELNTTTSFEAVTLTLQRGYVVVTAIDEPVLVHFGAIGAAATNISAAMLAGSQRRFLCNAGQTVNIRDVA